MVRLVPTLPTVNKLHVVEVDPQSDPRWEAFVAAHPDGSVFHYPAWLQVLARGSNHRPICFACVDDKGQFHGVLPLLATAGFWFNLGPITIRRRLSSLPRTPAAGPLALNSEATTLLVQAAIDRVRKYPGVTLELKLEATDLTGMIEGLGGVPWQENYVLELPEKPEELRFGNSVTRHRIKWAVKKATSLGVEVRQAETEEDLRAWYALYLATMRWHAGLPRPYKLFAAMWELLRPRGLMRLLLAEQCKEGQRRLLSGYLLLMGGRTVHCYVNGRRREDLGLHPNDVILWRAIHDACKEGFRRYNFLDVQGQHGLADYKVKWGAKPVPSYRYFFPAPGQIQQPLAREETSMRRFATAAWRRVPLQATALLGDWVHRYL